MMKKIGFLLLLILYLTSYSNAQNFIIKNENENYALINISKQVSKLSSLSLWNLNHEQAKRTIANYSNVQEIQSIIIYDKLIGKNFLIAEFDNGNITYSENSPLPNYLLDESYNTVSEKIIFNAQHIGDVIIYFKKNAKGYSLSLTQKEINFIQQNPILKVSNELDWPPFDFAIGNQPQGYFIDLLQIISKKSGLSFEMINGYGWHELFAKFKNKELDMVHPVRKTPIRVKNWLFSSPAFSYTTSFAIAKHQKEISSINDLDGKTIAVGKEFAVESYLSQNYPNVKLESVNNINEGLELLSKGLVDAVVDTEPVLKYLIQKNFLTNLKVSGWFKEYDNNDVSQLHFMTHKDKPELISIINKSLKTITPGELAFLEQKWFGQEGKRLNKPISFTSNEAKYLRNKRELFMCVLPHALPYEGIDEKGFHTGMAEDFISIFEKRIGYPIKLFRTNSWYDSHEAIKEGKCDLLPIAQKTAQRSEYLNFTPAFLKQQTVIATRTEELFVTSLNEVSNKQIAIVKNYAHANLIKEKYPSLNIVEVKDIHEGLEKVRKKDVYGYIDALGSIGYELQKQGSYDIKVAGKIGFNLELSTATRKEEPILNAIFTKAVNSLTKDEIQKIYNRWISIKVEQKADYTLVYQIASVVLLIMILMFIWNRKLQAEIQKRIIIEDELKVAQQKAIEANEAKSQFLANMTHDIRTPMNGILGMNNLATTVIDTDVNKAKDYITKSQSSAKILLGIINDILDFSKIEAGKLDIEYQAFSLRELVSQLNDMFNYQCEEKSLSFIIEQEELLPDYIMGDQLRISQILSNLLGNSIKFTQEGSITLTIELINKTYSEVELKFSVIDTGRGIKEENLSKLFESFSQENTTISQEYGGTGLGLAICKQLLSLMNGKIDVKSQYKKGSNFFFTIKTQLVQNETIEKIKKEKKSEALQMQNKILPCKILLVEDNEINKELACKFLENIVQEVDVARDGFEAIEKVFSNEYALVLMDIHMPNMDGYTATENIRANKKYSQLPIIAMTANALKSDVKKCLTSGMNDHIAKPISVIELNQKINKWAAMEAQDHDTHVYEIKSNNIEPDTERFDSKSALDRMIGRTDLYTNFLKKFLDHHVKDFDKALKLLKQNKVVEATTQIHTLKGIVKTLGAEVLGDMLLTVENKIDENISIEEDIKTIHTELDFVVSEVKKYLEKNVN